MRKVRFNQSGDTIIEVLIAIAILGSVLVGAFVSANRSLRGTQLSKDRVEALKLVQGQLEMLTAALEADPPTVAIPTAGTVFCFTNLAEIQDSACTAGANSQFQISLTRSDSNNREFEARAEWNSGGPNDPQRINLVYRTEVAP